MFIELTKMYKFKNNEYVVKGMCNIDHLLFCEPHNDNTLMAVFVNVKRGINHYLVLESYNEVKAKIAAAQGATDK